MERRGFRIAWWAAGAIAIGAAAGCGPLRLDTAPHVRGRIVAVGREGVTLRHKSGRTYLVSITPRTRILRDGASPAEMSDVCVDQRAHAVLEEDHASRAAELRIWGRRCEDQ